MKTTDEVMEMIYEYGDKVLETRGCPCTKDIRKAIEELQKNNERYLWLCKENADIDSRFTVCTDDTVDDDIIPTRIRYIGEDLSEAIDNAMKEQNNENSNQQ